MRCKARLVECAFGVGTEALMGAAQFIEWLEAQAA